MGIAAQILPQRGRGTMRSMVEGHGPEIATLPHHHESPHVPLHHLRWFPSPCRGGML